MQISNEGLLVILFVGLVAGWLAGKIVRGTGFGIIGDILVGIAGALIASYLFPKAWHCDRQRPRSGDHLFGDRRRPPVADRAADSRPAAVFDVPPAGPSSPDGPFGCVL